MNPNRGGEQPTPGMEIFPTGGAEQQIGTAEQTETPSSPESSPSRQPSVPPLPVIPQAPVINLPAISSASDDTKAVAPPQDNDSSKLEKQWVEKARSIIAQTKDDPFRQKNEMSKVKAAYIEKRFNKKLKVDDAKV